MKIKSNRPRHIFILVALASILLAMLATFIYQRSKPDRAVLLEKVNRRVAKQVSGLDFELKTVKETIQRKNNINFSNLAIPSQHVYYVFRDGKLIYWSDFKFVPTYNNIAGDYKYRFLDTKKGQYIVERIQVKKGEFEYEIFGLLPVFEISKIDNNYIRSGPNRDIFKSLQVRIFVSPGETDQPIKLGNTYLFSVEFGGNYRGQNTWLQALAVIFFTIAIIGFFYYLAAWIGYFTRKRWYGRGFLLLVGSLLVVRGAMLYFNLPFSVAEVNLFNSRFYASSIINPSLGDLLLNVLCLLIVAWYIFSYGKKAKIAEKILSSGKYDKSILAILLSFISFWALFFQFFILKTIYYNSQWSLDITRTLEFTPLKTVSLLIYFLTVVIYFFASHIIFHLLQNLFKNSKYLFFIYFFCGAAMFIIVSVVLKIDFEVVLLVNSFYFVVLYFLALPSHISEVGYITFMYFFLSAFSSAITGAYAIFTFEQVKEIYNKQRFASQLLTENDIYGEYLLAEAAEKIKNDVFIKSKFFTPFVSAQSAVETIEQKIRRAYLNNYFDKFDIQVYVFSSNGNSFIDSSTRLNFYEFFQHFDKNEFKTEYANIFYISEKGSSQGKRYLVFLDVERYGLKIGHILLDLKLKRIIPNSVYPELLVDKRFMPSYQNNEYSYALYERDELVYSSGIYNYHQDFTKTHLSDPDLSGRGFFARGFYHLGVNGQNERLIVISSERESWKVIISNFSFLFLIFVFVIISIIILNTVAYSFRKINLNYSTKIQLYLNVAFFLPLVVVSITTLSLISSSYTKEVMRQYLKRAESISSNIAGPLDRYIENLSREELSNDLAQLARYTETDINLFNINGRLITSSQPGIFEDDILSEYINSESLAMIKEQNNYRVVLTESIGKLSYNAAYIGIKSFETGNLIGILSIPFFESKADLERQIIGALTNIINIFTFIFIVFLLISYFASRFLTFPLKLIAQKIGRTTLAQHNEPLNWNSDDEIGMLVSEYNRMLVKLEESKDALTKSEKESAWREMAKQVAHEIKNPLTPMKLTLQHLRRMLTTNNNGMSEKVDKSIGTLLQQIDNLNDIATSFSSFAKMPIPENKPFEITSALQKTIELYNSNNYDNVQSFITEEDIYVLGDEKLMDRIFSNLIINAFQSIPAEREPTVKVFLQKNDGKVLIEFHDNGEGIRESIKEKVFIPNFSTKSSGSGLGLAIAKRGIEHAGGAIWFETKEQVGTSFFIELPVIK